MGTKGFEASGADRRFRSVICLFTPRVFPSARARGGDGEFQALQACARASMDLGCQPIGALAAAMQFLAWLDCTFRFAERGPGWDLLLVDNSNLVFVI